MKYIAIKCSVLLLTIFGIISGHPPSVNGADTRKSSVRNVILMIGDGMGPQQVGLLLSYAKQASNPVIRDRRTAFERLMDNGKIGISMTHAHNVLTTDSAASATQLATASYAGNEMIGLDHEGRGVRTILEIAKKSGRSVGLVSDTRITHATPAAFAAHQRHRTMENEIAVNILKSGADILLSGGWRHWIPKSAMIKDSPEQKAVKQLIPHATRIKSKRNDNRNLLMEAKNRGYTLAFDKAGLEQARGKILGLFSESAMKSGIINNLTKGNPNRREPTLREMSTKALQRLSDNPKGFFLMIEGGQIDWAGHQNDAGWMLHEMLKFNDTLDSVLDWMDGRDDTLLIVTADHETGGLGFSYSSADLPKPKQLPGEFFNSFMYQPNYNFGDTAILTKLYAQKLSYFDLFKKFDQLPISGQSPEALVNLVNMYTSFPISTAEAKRILETEENPYYKKNHYSLGIKRVPRMGEDGAFYVYTKQNRGVLLARLTATRQGLVWSTGTHTSTPVFVFSAGPEEFTRPFMKIMHHTELARKAILALTGK